MAWEEHVHANAPALADALAQTLLQACREALHAQGHARLALAGGRTPLPAYEQLAAAIADGGLGDALPAGGADITVLPTDERCVLHEHPASNAAALRAIFVDTPRVQVASLTTADGEAGRSLAHARALLAPWHGTPFDVVVLGMGSDAHTASLFPGADGVAQALDLQAPHDVCHLVPEPLPAEAPYARISLTVPRLLRAHRVILAITGEPKRDVLRRAQAGGDAVDQPIAAILHAPTAVQIHWSP